MACPCDLAGVTAALPAAMPALNIIFVVSVSYYTIKSQPASMLLVGIAIILAAMGNQVMLSAWMLAAGFYLAEELAQRCLSTAWKRNQLRRQLRTKNKLQEGESCSSL